MPVIPHGVGGGKEPELKGEQCKVGEGKYCLITCATDLEYKAIRTNPKAIQKPTGSLECSSLHRFKAIYA